MADNIPVPPPPPPHANRSVPPLPPSRQPAPVPPMAAPGVPPAAKPPAPLSPVQAVPVPSPRPAPMAMPGSLPPAAGPAVPLAGPSPLEQRLLEMEKRFQEQDQSKKGLEDQINELQQKLKEEHEKLIVQALKAKEEETLAVKVDQQLREMQERLRREKYEQELHESRSKAESQLKELERRIVEERETWMAALKNQLKERETVEREVEAGLTRRLQDFEHRYQTEKNEWMASLRQKDEEITHIRQQLQAEMEKLQEALEEKDDLIEEAKDGAAEQRRADEREHQSALKALETQLENALRDAANWKAQIAMLQSQLHQAEAQNREERNRVQVHADRLEEDFQEMRKRLEAQAASREQELQREFARRDQERAQYWEGLLAQVRAEKESLRGALMHREEDAARLQMALAEEKRQMEVERSQWKVEVEKVRRAAHEEAMQFLPGDLQQKFEQEREKWMREHANELDQMRKQLQRQAHLARETEKALAAKIEVEERRAGQEINRLQTELEKAMEARANAEKEAARLGGELAGEREQAEKQVRDFLDRIAELQFRESNLAEDLETRVREWNGQKAALSAEAERLRNELASAQAGLAERDGELQEQRERLSGLERDIEGLKQQAAAERTELQRQREIAAERQAQMEDVLQDGARGEEELQAMRREIKALAETQVEWKQKEQEWETSHNRLRETFNAVRSEIVQLQTERTERENLWVKKEAEWRQHTAELEKSRRELEKALEAAQAAPPAAVDAPAAVSAGPSAVPPEAVKALTAIRQQMQEMQTLLAWLRPIKKPVSKAA